MRKGGNNKQYKLSKLFSLLIILIIATTDVAPLVSVAVDTIKEDKETVEEITGEDEKGEDLELVIEDGDLEGDDIELEDEELEDEELEDEELEDEELEDEELEDEEFEGESETEDFIEEPQQTDKGIAMMSMSLQSTPTYVMATDADFSGTSNGSFKYIGNDAYVEIPHTIKGVKVTSYNNMFNRAGEGVQGVKSTNKNVTSMTNMFKDFQNHVIDVSQIDVSNVTQMGGVFSSYSKGVTKLTTIQGLGTWDTSKAINMSKMFYRSRVKDLDVSNFNTQNVVSMESMFEDSEARVIDVSGFNTTKTTSMASMFRDTFNITQIDLNSFDTRRVTSMSYMFSRTRAKDIKGIEKIDTSNVNNMMYMFNGTQVDNLDLSNFKTDKVRDMQRMFRNSWVKELDLSSFDTSNVINMTEMFENTRATSIIFGNNFNTSKVRTMYGMFYNSRATSLDVSGFDTQNVDEMVFMFRNSQATEIKGIENFNTMKVNKMSRMFEGSRANKLDLRSFDTRNVTDMKSMFANTKASVIDLSSFDTSRITDMSSMFEGSEATSINIDNFDTTYVTNMDSMFKDTKVKELDLSSFNMGSVNDTDNMFQGSGASEVISRTSIDADKLNNSLNKPTGVTVTPLYKVAEDSDFSGFLNGDFRYIGDAEYIEIPRTIKGINVNSYKNMFTGTSIKGVISTNTNVTDMSGMFKNTTSQEMDIRDLNTENVTNMASMFEGSDAQQLDLTKFDTTKVTNMSNMFRNAKVNELDLGSFDLSKVTNTNNMFQGASARIGYARTQEEVNKLNGSSNKPSGLVFTIWGITTTQSENNWTNKPIELTINAESSNNGIDYVEMVNETGRNYLLNSGTDQVIMNTNNSVTNPLSRGVENGVRWVSGRQASTNRWRIYTYLNPSYENGRGTRYSEDLYPIEGAITYSLDVMSHYPLTIGFSGELNTTLKPGQWTRISYTVNNAEGEVRPYSPNSIQHGTHIPLGAKLYYKNYKIEKGTEATPWKPAPEDSDSSSEQSDTFAIYNNGTYIFRATDTQGNTKTISHTVSNIDTTQPTAEITPSTSGWTSQDVELYVNAKDDLSGVESIKMPDGKVIKDTNTTYVAKDNGTYTFTITDKAGNSTTYTEEVNNIDRSIPKLTATIDNTSWTRDPINITVTSEESASGLIDIDMVRSPYTPAPEDIKLVNNSKTYPVIANGLYTFEATYNNGATSEVSVNITNIDLDAPEVTVLNNPEDWTEEDEITLEITAFDDKSGVKSITLPDGTEVKSNKVTYKVSENGDYEFIVKDNVGNVTTHTETVDRLMIQYGIYIYDSDNKPIEGADFELLVDGGVFKEATSDKEGYVDFGKVPPTWSYTIRQVSSPDGSVIPGDIEVEDPTDPLEIINYPRGTEMPSTGTVDIVMITVIITVLITVIAYVNKKKKENKK